MSNEREELTDDEVGIMAALGQTKALRIIDAHAADRAALVAQLEAANQEWERDIRLAAESVDRQKRLTELAELSATAHRCKSEELTRERDEALREVSRWIQHARSAELQTCSAQEGLRIQAERANDCANESRALRTRLEAAESEVTRLTEALAAAEAQASEFKYMYEGEKLSVHNVCDRAEAAEARVLELEALRKRHETTLAKLRRLSRGVAVSGKQLERALDEGGL